MKTLATALVAAEEQVTTSLANRRGEASKVNRYISQRRDRAVRGYVEIGMNQNLAFWLHSIGFIQDVPRRSNSIIGLECVCM